MNIKTLFINTQTNLYLFSLVILFSLCDIITSVLCMQKFGYIQESNIFIRYIMLNNGVLGFFIIKVGLTLIFLGIINYIIIKNNYFVNKKISAIYLGIIISNAYVSISNIFVLQGKESFYLLQLNIFQILLIIFCIIFCIIIILFLKNIMNIKKTVYSNLYKPIHRLLCMKKIIILELIIILCFVTGIGSSNDDFWQSDNTIVTGLTDVGANSAPTVYKQDYTWYLLSGSRLNGWYGWRWATNTWVVDTDVTDGLVQGGAGTGEYLKPVVTTEGQLIIGTDWGIFRGYIQTYEWEDCSDCVAGLTKVDRTSAPTVFQKDGIWYLIAGHKGYGDFGFYGWRWAGEEWESYPIEPAIPAEDTHFSPTAFQINNTWYLISGTYGGTLYGWKWYNYCWNIDNNIISGLSTGAYKHFAFFEKYGKHYLIVGNSGGTWEGYNMTGDIGTAITFRFEDACGNLISNSEGYYCEYTDVITCYPFNEPDGILNIESFSTKIEIFTNTFMGETRWVVDPIIAGTTYIIQNPFISWNNNIMVVDGNTSGLDPISGTLVSLFQNCIIDPSVYPSRNKFTNSSGIVNFEQCELDSFSLGVSADGYKSYSGSISSSAMDAFISSQTVMIKLYPVGDEENESEYIYTDYNTWVKFKNVDGNYTSTILDTDEYVDLYYYNNNSEGIGMTLKFQKYGVDTGIIDLLSWDIPIDTEGYKRILKTNYTDVSYLYIGYLYNYTIDGWDKTKYLAVRNETDEIVLNYENLSTSLWFRYKNIEGNIDYRENINIYAYANTSYVGLFNISLELYDNAVYVEHINLTWANFVNADFFFYEWNPDYSYINGHNYTVRMHGYDYYLLETDYINATDYRKNKLTILVKNQDGIPLDNAFIYLEDYGLLSTGVNNYNSYENLDNGYYRYKATKPNYVGTGWSDITITDSDEIVTYVLTWSGSEEGSTMQQQKINDSDLSNIYLILMAIVLIFVIFGGFIYATK